VTTTFRNHRRPQRRPNCRTRLFVEAYLSSGGNAGKAARELGYSHPRTTGPHKANEPAVRALIKRRLDEIAVNREEVIGSLVMIMRDHTDSKDPAMAFNALLAATELCKIFGLSQSVAQTKRRSRQHD
jgi:hypothetical protein